MKGVPSLMRKTLLILVCILLSSVVALPQNKSRRRSAANVAAQARNLSPREIAQIAYPSTVSIYSIYRDTDDVYTGVGFFVAPNLIVTCYHVVKDADGIVVTPINKSENKHLARLVRYDAVTDVALLSTSTLTAPPLKLLLNGDMYVGEAVYTLGNPKGLEGTFSNGIASNFHQEDELFYMQFTAPVSPGSSGGPVFNSKGLVVGMVNMQLREGQNLNFAVMSIHLKMVLANRKELPPNNYIDDNLNSPQ